MKSKKALAGIVGSFPAFLVLAAAFLCLPASGPAHAAGTLEKIAQTGRITLGYRNHAIPFSYLDANKQPVGYSIDLCMKFVDLIRRELKRPDIAVKLVEVDMLNHIDSVVEDVIDLECSSSAITPERLKRVSFSVPTFISTIRIMVREGSGIKSLANLAGKSVVTIKEGSSIKLFNDLNQLRGLNAKLVMALNLDECFAMLESGRVDAYVINDVLLYGKRAMSRDPLKLTIMRDALAHDPFAIMMRKEDPAFKNLIDAEITRIILSGEIAQIYRKWFESPIPPSDVNLNMPMSYMMAEFMKSPGEWKAY